METKKIDLRTPKQREKDNRNIRIISVYKEIISNEEEEGKASFKSAIYRGVGLEFGLSASGVRMVLLKNGVIEK